MDKLDDLVTFIRVVDAKSFTGAAQRLAVAKSVVSRRIAELENRLGVRLLNRTTRSLSLTEVGHAFYDRCVRILADVDEAERAVTSLHAEPRGLLRVTASVSFALRHLPLAVAGFLERYGEVELDISLNDRFVDLVEEGYDVAIRIGRLRDSSLVARKLAPTRRVAVASAAYLARHGRPEHPTDLARHACLIYTNASTADQWQFQIDGTMTSVRVGGRLRSNNGDLLRDAAVAGGGVAIMPSFIVAEELAAGKLELVLPGFSSGEIGIYAVYPHNRHLSAKVRGFVDHLVQVFGPVPVWERQLDAVLAGPAAASVDAA
ncbi:MAG TPA: LysR family transcriptional regulator [Alphaproteobacteria bacterium]|nr:LysR family transcriptional regulator [Alphaproteobacteria bacterium]